MYGLVESSVLYYYYPYGFLREGGSYRYGYNGMQREDAIAGAGNTYDFGARLLSSLYGSWFSIDPLAGEMPSWSPYSFGFANPIFFIDPDGEKPTHSEAARMAAHVYGNKTDAILTGGWRVSQKFSHLNVENATGLKTMVYERPLKNGTTEYALAFAGSEDWKDWISNFTQPIGLSKQYKSAAIVANNFVREVEKVGAMEITFVGHSQGGGQAYLAAYLTQHNAITFNAAYVAEPTIILNMWGIHHRNNTQQPRHAEAYQMNTDLLTSSLAPNGIIRTLYATDFSSLINGHSMDNILKHFGVRDPSAYDKPVTNSQSGRPASGAESIFQRFGE